MFVVVLACAIVAGGIYDTFCGDVKKLSFYGSVLCAVYVVDDVVGLHGVGVGSGMGCAYLYNHVSNVLSGCVGTV